MSPLTLYELSTCMSKTSPAEEQRKLQTIMEQLKEKRVFLIFWHLFWHDDSPYWLYVLSAGVAFWARVMCFMDKPYFLNCISALEASAEISKIGPCCKDRIFARRRWFRSSSSGRCRNVWFSRQSSRSGDVSAAPLAPCLLQPRALVTCGQPCLHSCVRSCTSVSVGPKTK